LFLQALQSQGDRHIACGTLSATLFAPVAQCVVFCSKYDVGIGLPKKALGGPQRSRRSKQVQVVCFVRSPLGPLIAGDAAARPTTPRPRDHLPMRVESIHRSTFAINFFFRCAEAHRTVATEQFGRLQRGEWERLHRQLPTRLAIHADAARASRDVFVAGTVFSNACAGTCKQKTCTRARGLADTGKQFATDEL
jgi:hypothetical protein